MDTNTILVIDVSYEYLYAVINKALKMENEQDKYVLELRRDAFAHINNQRENKIIIFPLRTTVDIDLFLPFVKKLLQKTKSKILIISHVCAEDPRAQKLINAGATLIEFPFDPVTLVVALNYLSKQLKGAKKRRIE